MLLVDDDQPEPAQRREDRRARADDDPRLAARDPLALVAALGVRQPRMEQGDALAEAGAEAAERLRSERDLRHEHDRAETPLEPGGAGLEVHLGLAAARGAVEEEIGAFAAVHRADDASECGLLLGRQLGRRGLAAERLPLRRLRPLDPPLRRLRRDERERAAVRRAVVVGEPEREVDERGRQSGDDRLDGLRVDPLRRLVGDLDDDSRARVGRRSGRERPRPSPRRPRPVGERPVERAGGDEREDGGEAGHGGPA